MPTRKANHGSYRVFRLTSWEAFLKLVVQAPYSNWAFRGERDERWPLYSSLSRYLKNFGVDPRAWVDQESRILRVFKRKAHQFLVQPPEPDDDFQWLALMQHHGAPTRLIDFTWSPYVAAFFALERKERRYIGRPGEIDQPRGRAVVLHQRQPLKVVVGFRGLDEKLVRFAFEDAQNAAFLIHPGPWVDAEVLQVARERTIQRPALIAFAAERPVGIRRLHDQLEKRLPGCQPDDAIGPVACFARRHLLHIVA